jgi:hypothetical protein
MYLLLLLGENKDKSINPFFIVATMPSKSMEMMILSLMLLMAKRNKLISIQTY